MAAFVLEDRRRVLGLCLLVDNGLGLTGQHITPHFNLLKISGLRMGLTRQGQESESRDEDKDVPHKGSSYGWEERLRKGQPVAIGLSACLHALALHITEVSGSELS
jgi:hypothetical protein